jgi:hypothetical protein
MARGGTEWIGLDQDRNQWRALLRSEMNLGEAGKLLSSCITGDFSRRDQIQEVSYFKLVMLIVLTSSL